MTRQTGTQQVDVEGGEAVEQPARTKPASSGAIYLRYVIVSALVVLGFGTFQHTVVLDIPFSEMRVSFLIVPAVVGSVFGFLLAKVRILNTRLEKHMDLVLERDRRLEQEIEVRQHIEDSLMEQRRQLEVTNEELKSFSYSVSHDLRAPLRAISGFSQALFEDYHERLDDTARNYLTRVEGGCRRMDEMIDSLLVLSRVSAADIRRETVDLSAVAREVLDELEAASPKRSVAVDIEPHLLVEGDRRLLKVVLENLLGNAWKFTARTANAHIEFFRSVPDGGFFCVRDNGAGFDQKYMDRLFTPFARLHQQHEFPGSGIGLATVQRALLRQGGRIQAEGAKGKGASFRFSV